MRVLHVINSLHTGGAERLLVETVPLLNKYIKTDVLLLNGDETLFKSELQHASNSAVYCLGTLYYNPFYIFKLIPYLYRYDIVHVHLFPAQYFVVLAKVISFNNVKLVFTEHSTSNRRLEKACLKPLERFIYRFYKKVICITSQVKASLQGKLELQDSRLEVINNGINIKKIEGSSAYMREDFGYQDSDILIVMVAGFRYQKDHETLIKTVSQLPHEYKLLLVGEGEKKEALKKLIDELNLLERVTFLGARPDVYSVIKMCDISVLSSHCEGFGLAAAEAMACGVPTIGSNVDGLAQVVEGGGILFNKGSIDDLKSKILSLRDFGYRAHVIDAGKAKAALYDIHTMVAKTLDLYRGL